MSDKLKSDKPRTFFLCAAGALAITTALSVATMTVIGYQLGGQARDEIRDTAAQSRALESSIAVSLTTIEGRLAVTLDGLDLLVAHLDSNARQFFATQVREQKDVHAGIKASAETTETAHRVLRQVEARLPAMMDDLAGLSKDGRAVMQAARNTTEISGKQITAIGEEATNTLRGVHVAVGTINASLADIHPVLTKTAKHVESGTAAMSETAKHVEMLTRPMADPAKRGWLWRLVFGR